MHSIKSFRPQNQNPEGLIRYSKEIGRRNEKAVLATIQAMQRRRVASHEITVQAVARESGVSRATIYHSNGLFAMVRKANPQLRHRDSEQGMRDAVARANAEAAAAVDEKEQHKKEAGLALLGTSSLQQQITWQKKKILELQSEIAYLKELRSRCTCESKNQKEPPSAR